MSASNKSADILGKDFECRDDPPQRGCPLMAGADPHISSDTGEGNISMIELPPIANEMKPPEVKVPSGELTEVPNFPSANAADPYRILSPRIYGITV